MNIADCLKNARLKAGLAIVDVAVDVQITPDKLSRIERGLTEPTLSLIGALCSTLHLSLDQLLGCMEIEMTGTKKSSPNNKAVATPELAAQFLRYFASDIHGGVELLASLWRMVESEFLIRDISILGGPNNSVEALVTHFIRKYPSLTMEMNFPHELNAQQVLAIHEAGGILSLPEIGLFVKSLRQNAEETMKDFAKSKNRSLQLLSRLESGQIDDIRFKDVVLLDESFHQHGTIIQMYWNAMVYSDTMHFSLSVSSFHVNTVDFARAVYLFTTLCRWVQFKFADQTDWLQRIESWCSSATLRWDQKQDFMVAFLEQYELTTDQWKLIQAWANTPENPFLVDSDYLVLGAVIFNLISGWSWERLPAKYGPFEICRGRYFDWCKTGRWEAIWKAFLLYQSPAQQDRLMSNFRAGGSVPIDPAIFRT